jgi:putative ATPase
LHGGLTIVKSWLEPAQTTISLARAPKSNLVATADTAAAADTAATARVQVSLHLRNAVTALMKKVGCGQGYRDIHDDLQAREQMASLPETLQGRVYFERDAHEGKPR